MKKQILCYKLLRVMWNEIEFSNKNITDLMETQLINKYNIIKGYIFKEIGKRNSLEADMFLKELDIKDKDNIISLALFGSYNTEQWIKNKSDIDILVLLNERKGVSFEFELEDKLIPLLENFYEYNNIQLTFLYLNEFDSIFAKCYIESKDKVIFDINKEIDFRLYVNKYLRNNEWLNSLIKEDTELLRRGY